MRGKYFNMKAILLGGVWEVNTLISKQSSSEVYER